MRFPAKQIGAIIACELALAGCAAPSYAPIGSGSGGYGYSDVRNADGGYTVRVVAINPAQAHEFWDRRAAELCGDPNFRKNIFRAEIPVSGYTGYVSGVNGYGGSYTEDRYGALTLEGYLHCESAAAARAEADASAPSQPDAPQ